MVDVLHPKRDKNRKALRCQRSESVHLADAKGHDRIQPVHLLELQDTKLAEVLSGGSKQRFGVVVELLFGVRRVNHRQDGKHHALVSGGQIVQKLLHFPLLLLHVVGHSGGEIVILILFALPVGDVGLNAQQAVLRLLNRFVSGNRHHINAHHQIAVHVGQLCHHAVLDIGRILTQKQHPAITISQLEIVLLELHRIRADEILEAVTLLASLLQVKAEVGFFSHTIEVVKNAEPFFSLQLHALAAQPPKVSNQVCTHSCKIGSRILYRLLIDRDRHILVLHDGISASRLFQEHFVILFSVLVQLVALQGNKNGFLKVQPVQAAVVDGDFGCSAAVKGEAQSIRGTSLPYPPDWQQHN